MTSRLYVNQFDSDLLQITMKRALDWLDWTAIIKPGARVVIKPNFTYPFHKPGVTTSPKVIEALILLLCQHTDSISIVESDGGSNSWTADQSFEGHNMPELCQKFGIRCVNLSKSKTEIAEETVLGRKILIPLPSFLLHETDVFITMPVPKVHAMTGVTLAFKNQWGCLSDARRIKHHPDFDYKIVAINKLLQPRMVIFDGTYFLNRMGPMDGDLVEKRLLIASNDIGAGSLACCQIMGIDPLKIHHHQVAMQEGMFPVNFNECEMNQSPLRYKDQVFYVQRDLQRWAAYWAFHSQFGTNLFYMWPFSAKLLHKILYAIKGKPEDFSTSY